MIFPDDLIDRDPGADTGFERTIQPSGATKGNDSMKQIVIVCESKEGLVAEIAETLAGRNINIETIDAEESGNVDVVTLTVDKYDEALQALLEIGINAVTEDVVLLRLPDQPGALARVAKRFKENRIHLRSIRLIHRDRGVAIVAVSMDRTDEAMELVKEYRI